MHASQRIHSPHSRVSRSVRGKWRSEDQKWKHNFCELFVEPKTAIETKHPRRPSPRNSHNTSRCDRSIRRPRTPSNSAPPSFISISPSLRLSLYDYWNIRIQTAVYGVKSPLSLSVGYCEPPVTWGYERRAPSPTCRQHGRNWISNIVLILRG